MASKLIFKDAEKVRDAIMDSQKKEIAALYDSWADDISERAKFYSYKTNASAPLSERYYKELQKQLRATSQEVSNEVYNKIKKNMYTVADAVVSDNIKWLESFGFSKDGLNAAFSYVPDEIVRNLITGQIYDRGWSLSSRIWGDNEQTLKDIYQVMAKGLAENKPIYQIAKDLEIYVRPSAKLPWNLKAKDGVKIYKKQVDYNAQRLARTLVQHGYQQSFVATTQKNPFITEYIWRSNGSRVCELCVIRDGVHFKKEELPLDHPNGMCTMEPAIVDDMIDQLANWFNSPEGTYPEIDSFAINFGYEIKTNGLDMNAFANKFGKVTTNNSAQVFKSKLSDSEYKEWFTLQKQAKSELGYGFGSGKDFWADYSSGKIKYDRLDDFFAKNLGSVTQPSIDEYIVKYGKSDKSWGAYVKSLSPIQKSEAKFLKDKAGMTWQKWYESNIYTGTGPSANYKKASKAVKVDDAFEVQLKKAGFKDSAMPKNYKTFNDWYYSDDVDWGSLKKLSSSLGYEGVDTVALEKHFNDYMAKQVSKTSSSKIVTKIDDVFDSASWYDSVKSNDTNLMNAWTDDWLKLITSEEKSGVVTYTSNAYNNMNSYLRGLRSETSYSDEIKACQSALAKASLPEETIVRRGSDYNMLDGIGFKGIVPEDKSSVIGAIVEDKGFVSTSPASSGGFSGSIEYVIKVPKGSQAMYVDSISKYQGEQEILINCGGKYKVEDVVFNDYGLVKKIFMTLINLQ